jgi:hypothetical protein
MVRTRTCPAKRCLLLDVVGLLSAQLSSQEERLPVWSVMYVCTRLSLVAQVRSDSMQVQSESSADTEDNDMGLRLGRVRQSIVSGR